LINPEQELREGDRVEIYRPLIADPKEGRRLRAAQGKKLKKEGVGVFISTAAPVSTPSSG